MKLLLAALVLLVPMTAHSAPDSPSGGQPSTTTVVRGSVLLVEGEYVTVKEMSGREVRVHVNAETKLENLSSKVKVGDKIEAMITPDGHATSVGLQATEAPPVTPASPVPPGAR
jgi:hypothetical protein